MRLFNKKCLDAVFLGAIIFPTFVQAVNPEKAKLLEHVQFTDCATCHESEDVLPPKHVSVTAAENKNCAECHNEEATRLRGRIPLSHTHLANDVTCLDCHGQKPFTFVSTDRCRECHGEPEDISAMTKTEEEFNPHESPHYGNDMDCDMCHHLHTRSENICGECHDLDRPTP